MRLCAIFGLAVFAACFCHADKRPNVLVILTDDQGWGDLSRSGNANLSTPHLDRLAEQGASFTNFYVAPVCSPTRAEFLTGRYYPRSGVYSTGAGGERMDPDEETIAEVFNQAGYATAAFGKWHNGTQAPYHPLVRGFDEYYGFTSGHWGSYFDPLLDHNGAMVQGEGYLPDDLTTHAIDFMSAAAEGGSPFFVYLAFPTPHSPMQTTDADWKRFRNKPLVDRHIEPEKEDLDHTRAALAMVENIDQNVGRILNSLDRHGLAEDTLVVFFSDNGPNGWRWNGGMRGRKGSTDEGGVRSPLFVRWPAVIDAGRQIEQIAGAIDLLPTLAELAQLPHAPSKPLDGISLASALRGSAAEPPDRILVAYWAGKFSARDQRFRLDSEGRLYRIAADRGQTHDVADDYPAAVARLEDAIADYRESVIPEDFGEERPLTVGYPGMATTQLPARDASWTGDIRRSNRWPNCSYLTNWTRDSEEIYWSVEVGQAGRYRATVYYTCPSSAVGTRLTLSTRGGAASGPLTEPHDPPAYGGEYDRVPREESYVKDFRPLELGVLSLESGPAKLSLAAEGLTGSAGPDFRLLILESLP